jgi:DNA damage-inducible protein 1
MIIFVRTPETGPDDPLEVEIDEATDTGLLVDMVASLTGRDPALIDILVPGTNQIMNADTVVASLDLGKVDAFEAVFRRNNESFISELYDSAEQRRILAQIQRQRIEDNMRYAAEHAPESLVRYSLLLLDLTLNGHDLRVIVDTGAQTSLLPAACAQRCDVAYLIDRRCQALAIGIGTQRSIGRIHSLQLTVGGVAFTNPFAVVDGPLRMPLLGIDWLRKNRAVVDLSAGPGCLVLQGGAVRVAFGTESRD